jgi:hypothetical protein
MKKRRKLIFPSSFKLNLSPRRLEVNTSAREDGTTEKETEEDCRKEKGVLGYNV